VARRDVIFILLLLCQTMSPGGPPVMSFALYGTGSDQPHAKVNIKKNKKKGYMKLDWFVHGVLKW
jgi:hypothetical protein